jgi:AcrR family transcriptional regulator
MSPRPRAASDEEIFDAVTVVVSRLGPIRLTLADIAAEVGITAGALVQRFGSKRELLLAASRYGHRTVHDRFAALRDSHASPLEALLAFATSMARVVSTPEEMANQLAFLEMELTDPEFHEAALLHFLAEREEVRRLLEEAVAAGELAADTDTARLARSFQVALNGGRLLWAVLREGSFESWVRDNMDALLAPYRPKRRRRVSAAAPASAPPAPRKPRGRRRV